MKWPLLLRVILQFSEEFVLGWLQRGCSLDHYWVVVPVLGHVLKHVLEQVPKHMPDKQVPEHMLARDVLGLKKKFQRKINWLEF